MGVSVEKNLEMHFEEANGVEFSRHGGAPSACTPMKWPTGLIGLVDKVQVPYVSSKKVILQILIC